MWHAANIGCYGRGWVSIRRDLGPTAYALLLIPFGVYLASYAPWFASETAIDRHEVGQSIGPKSNFPLPDAIRSLWHYTAKAYQFHAGLTNSAGNYHPWESKPWAWPMSLRPVLYAIDQQNVAGCGAQSCVKAVMLVGTPAMWWLSVPSSAAPVGGRSCAATGGTPWCWSATARAGCLVRRHRPADVLLLCGDHGAVLVMAIALILGDILYKPGQGAERRTLGPIAVSCYVALVLTNFAWLFPILTGQPISQTTWNMEIWLPSWR